VYNATNENLKGFKIKTWGMTRAGGFADVYFLTKKNAEETFPWLSEKVESTLIPIGVHYNA